MQMGTKITTVIFDLDGTLLDTLQDLADSTNYALRVNGLPERSVEDIRMFVGNGVRLLVERAVPGGAENPCFEQVSREEAVYVGDSEVDIATARNAGLPCLSVLWGFRDRDLLIREGATRLIGSPEEILVWLEQENCASRRSQSSKE